MHPALKPASLLPPALDHWWVMSPSLKLHHQDSTTSRSIETQPSVTAECTHPQGQLTVANQTGRDGGAEGSAAAPHQPPEGDRPGEKTQSLRAANLLGNQFAESLSLTCANGKVCAGNLGLSAFKLRTAVSLRQSGSVVSDSSNKCAPAREMALARGGASGVGNFRKK